MSTAFIAHLPDRGAVAVTGPDAAKFLQGLVTNDVAHLETAADDVAFRAAAAHAALLSAQGKILFDFFCVRTPQGFVLEVAMAKAADLAKRLAMYKLRAAVAIEDVSEAFDVLALWGKNACSSGPTIDTVAFADPRHADLGTRILAEKRFARDIASATNGTAVDTAAYHAHRIALGVPEGGKDYDFGDAYPHEADFDLFAGVSFTKGCYVGQEIVARMQHKTAIRKRVVRVRGEAPLATGRPDVLAGDVSLGRLGSVAGTHGLALLRLDRAQEFSEKGIALTAGGTAIMIDSGDLARYAARNAVPDGTGT